MLQELISEMKARDKKIEQLTFWINELRQRQFGRKSESLKDQNQRELDFIIEGMVARKELPLQQPEPEPDPEPPPPEGKKKGHGRLRIPKNLLRNMVIHDVPEKNRRCACCRKALIIIGEEATEQVEYVPASVHAKRHVRLKYGCPNAKCRGTVVLADLPQQAIPKCKAAEGMLAFIIWRKFGAHEPLYRIEEHLANHGFPASRSTFWEWTREAAMACEPIVNYMKKQIQESPIIETDETPVDVRDDEHGVMRQGRQWVYVNKEHTVFEFSVDRKKEHPKAFLENTKGTVLSDAYPGYRSIAQESGGRLINAFCMAHARRKFWKALDTDRQRAVVGLAYIRALYEVEGEGKELAPAKLKALRRRKSRPILEKFKGWLDEQGQAVLPKSPIGKAIAYARKNWEGLTRFVDDGNLRIDNNRSEQQLRPWALGRKNWLRFESVRGGRVAAILGSLVASCRRHGKNPFEYFRDVLRRLPNHPNKKIRELTPAHWKPKPDTS